MAQPGTEGDERDRLRRRFEEAADLYDRARPTYPAGLVADLVDLIGIGRGSRVLEIGVGTGQLTVPLARLGSEITGIELGADLAALAGRNLDRYPNARVIEATFEDWPLPDRPFDAVVAATAFHWIDPAIRVDKSADALRRGGFLATVATHHVEGGDGPFFRDVQACYEAWDPDTPAGLRLPSVADIPFDGDEIERSGWFDEITFRRHVADIAYSAEEYRNVLLTYSGHRSLDPERQRGLLDCIDQLIDTRYGGRITKRYLFELRVARAGPGTIGRTGGGSLIWFTVRLEDRPGALARLTAALAERSVNIGGIVGIAEDTGGELMLQTSDPAATREAFESLGVAFEEHDSDGEIEPGAMSVDDVRRGRDERGGG